MKEWVINTDELRRMAPSLRAGDRVRLSGTVYTARDAAHQRLMKLLDDGEPLPFDLQDAVIYYAGATPAPEGYAIGSCGPTTSGRMDAFSPRLYDLGVCATIGKGVRDEKVAASIRRNRAVYLCAIGGAGALAAQKITACEVIAFDDLGCEAIRRIEMRDFPLIVGMDAAGGSMFG